MPTRKTSPDIYPDGSLPPAQAKTRETRLLLRPYLPAWLRELFWVEESTHFDAFLSYSHRDDEDGIAEDIQMVLQRFGRIWYQARARRVFRDVFLLSAAVELYPELSHHVRNSDHFILLCSPNAASSGGVAFEVAAWMSRPETAADLRSRTILLLWDGFVRWMPEGVEGNALPSTLAELLPVEVLFVDLRPIRKQPDREARRKLLERALAPVAAKLGRTTPERLLSQDLKRHRILRAMLVGVIFVLLLLVVGLARSMRIATIEAARAQRGEKAAEKARDAEKAQRKEAEWARLLAEERARTANSRALAARSVALGRSQQDLSLLLAVAAADVSATVEARSAVFAALEAMPPLEFFLTGHIGRVSAMAGTPDGRRLVVGKGDGMVEFYDLEARRLAGHAKAHPMTVRSVVITADGRTAVTGADDGSVVVWNVTTGVPIHKLSEQFKGMSALTYVENVGIAIGGSGRIAFRTLGGAAARPDVKLTRYAKAFTATPDGQVLAYLDGDDIGMVRLDNNNQQEIGRLTTNGIASISFAHTHLLLAYGAFGGQAGVLNINDLSRSWRTAVHSNDVLSLSFTRDDKAVVTGSNDNTIRITDSETGTPIGPPWNAHTDHVYALAAGLGGRFVSGGQEGRLLVWDANRLFAPGRAWLDLKDRRSRLLVQPNGDWVAAAAPSGGLEFRRAANGGASQNFSPKGVYETPLVFSDDGSALAVAVSHIARSGNREDDDIRIFRLSGDRWYAAELVQVRPHSLLVAAAFDGPGSLSVVYQDGVLEQRPLSGSKPLVEDLGAPSIRVASFQNAQRLLVATLDDVRYYSLGPPVRLLWRDKLPGKLDVAAPLGPDSNTFIFGGENIGVPGRTQPVPTVLFFQFPPGAPVSVPSDGHWPGNGYFPLTQAAATPDGALAATGDNIGQVLLWDGASRQQIGVPWKAIGSSLGLAVQVNGIRSISFGGPKGSPGLLAGTVGEIPFQLEVGLECWKEQACRLANRVLSPDEVSAYLGDLKSETCRQVFAKKSAGSCRLP